MGRNNFCPQFQVHKTISGTLELDGTEIELLDRPHLAPILLAVFDKVEECLNRGIHKPGCARNRLGELHLDNQTIMYHVGKDVFGKNDGDSILDNGCYIFAILDCEGCIVRKRGNISLRNSTYEEIVELIEKAIQKDRNILKKFLLDGRVFDFCLCRFGTPDGKHKTLEEVSRELGITCELRSKWRDVCIGACHGGCSRSLSRRCSSEKNVYPQ